MEVNLKTRTARTIKWNVIDRFASQLLYAVTGVVLARLLSTDDFGLVGAVLVFQTFASLFVDSGFSYALIQRKSPSQTDYSTVLWFNLSISIILYIILFFCAPLIADCFQHDSRLISLSRVMFLTLIINASTIVQTNRLMKRMDVKMVAVSNSIGLIIAGVTGISLAIYGYGAWAIVWQSITLTSVKTFVLWTSERWMPTLTFSFSALKSYFGIGSRMMLTSFFNTLFLNIYSFFIGNRAGLSSLGYYTQSDRWSKMGITSISQVFTSSFLPALSAVQDDNERYLRACSRMNRLAAYILFPSMLWLIMMAPNIFHTLFDNKWDNSIALFQLLLARGIFTILIGIYNNFLLAKNHPKAILWIEILRDGVAFIVLIATLPFINESRGDNPVWGLELLIFGQLLSSFVAWVVTLIITTRFIKASVRKFISDLFPYFFLSLAICAVLYVISNLFQQAILNLALQIIIAFTLYFVINFLSGSKIQREAIAYIMKKPLPSEIQS